MTELEQIEAWIEHEANDPELHSDGARVARLATARKVAAEIRSKQETKRCEVSNALLNKQPPNLKPVRTLKRKTK